MKATAVLIKPIDNVVTVLQPMKKGDIATYLQAKELCSIPVEEDIPIYHKIALSDIAVGEYAIKYGEQLGCATANISKGCWVSDLNLMSMPRNYDDE